MLGGMTDSRRVLVTGAAGFIGARVVRALVARGCKVVAMVRPGSNSVRLEDLRGKVEMCHADFHMRESVAQVLDAMRPDVLIHAAWHAEPGSYLDNPGNVDDLQASLELFNLASAHGCRRVLGIGTCLEYDTEHGYLSEEVELAPRSLYASTKAALYLAASAWATATGVSFAWARLFYQFGPGEDARRLIPSVIQALLLGQSVGTTNGVQVRDYLHVDDVAEALAQLALSAVRGPVNIGSGVPITVRDLVELVERETGRVGLVLYGDLASPSNEPRFLCANASRLQNEVGWRASRTVRQGIAETIAWWESRCPEGTLESGA